MVKETILQQLIRSKLSLYWIFVFVLALGGFNLLLPEVIHAEEGKTAVAAPTLVGDAQSSDLACRICHEETDAEITFPSGETLPVQVDLNALSHSAHGMQAEDPLACTDCHLPLNDYQVPHTPVDAIDYRDYKLQRSVSCERCHQEPHLISHPGQDTDMPVGCTDCHGSHEVQTVDAWQSGDSAQLCDRDSG